MEVKGLTQFKLLDGHISKEGLYQLDEARLVEGILIKRWAFCHGARSR